MIERAFEEARLHKENKRNAVRQFAIDRAMDLLKAAGVVDPAIKDQAVDTKPQKAVEQPFYVISEGTGIRFTCDIGGKPVDQLEAEVKSVRKASDALNMMHGPKFTTLEEVTPQELIKLRVRDFGLTGTPTTTQVFERATHSRIGNMALELCRAEVGPHQAIADTEQPLNDVYYIAYEPITDRDGDPSVFGLERDDGGLWLYGPWAGPEGGWDPEDQLVFALRKIEPVKA